MLGLRAALVAPAAAAAARAGLSRGLRASAPLLKKKPQPVETHDYPGGQTVPIVSEMQWLDADLRNRLAAYRVMNPDGSIRADAARPEGLTTELLLEMYQTMVRLQEFDDVMLASQRQGRVSFFMSAAGEEAATVASAAALAPDDIMFTQYREAGALMWRGFTLQQFCDQCCSNVDDVGKGRQMPVHYGSAELHFQTVSSPLTTQLPQAAGAAYQLKRAGEDRIVVCYFGDGAASEGDFHAALNMASTLDCPVLFFCRNNGFAISTSVADQFRGDGIAARGPGYGIRTVRVDGNDTMAVFEATRAAREFCLQEQRPVLLEAMSYRQGHHSTSDDSTRYRDVAEIRHWQDTDSPTSRLRAFLEAEGAWSADEDEALRKQERKNVLAALNAAEEKAKPPIDDLFLDVFDEPTPELLRQQQELHAHIAKYPEHYAGGGH